MRSMVIDMNDEQMKPVADFQGLPDCTAAMDFAVAEDEPEPPSGSISQRQAADSAQVLA